MAFRDDDQIVGLPRVTQEEKGYIEVYAVTERDRKKVNPKWVKTLPEEELQTFKRFRSLEACSLFWKKNPSLTNHMKLFRGCWVPSTTKDKQLNTLYKEWVEEQLRKQGSLIENGLFERDPKKDICDKTDAVLWQVSPKLQRFINELVPSVKTGSSFKRSVLKLEKSAVRVVAASEVTGFLLQTTDKLVRIVSGDERSVLADNCSCARTLLQLHHWLGDSVPDDMFEQISGGLDLTSTTTVDSIVAYLSTEDGTWHCVDVSVNKDPGGRQTLLNSIEEVCKSAPVGTLMDKLLFQRSSRQAPDTFPLTQVVCNLTRDIEEAKVTPCTEIGHKIAFNLVRVAASKIFADPTQAAMEIVANAIDAQSHNENPIGRFGMGFFSIFGLLLDGTFDVLTVVTTSAHEQKLTTFELVVTLAENGELVANLTRLPKPLEHTGTRVTLLIKGGKMMSSDVYINLRKETIKFRFVSHVNIYLGKQHINKNSARADRSVHVTLTTEEYSVVDTGEGMNKEQVQKLLIPSDSSKGLKSVAAAEKDDRPHCKIFESGSLLKLFICVNEVVVKEISIRTTGSLPHSAGMSVVLLPASCKLPVARDNVFLSDPHTFTMLASAFATLVDMHLEMGNVIDLRALVDSYARDAFQPEAYKLVEQVDKRISESKVLLIPNNQDIKRVCNLLGLKFTVSDIFSATHIERALLAAAEKTAGVTTDETIFAHNTAIIFDSFGLPIQKSVFLPSLVFLDTKTSRLTIKEFCQDPTNACMMVETFTALVAESVLSPIDPNKFALYNTTAGDHDREKRRALVFDAARLPLVNNAAILWTNLLTGLMPNPHEGFEKFIELWLRVDMAIARLDETLAVLMQRLCMVDVQHGYSGKTYKMNPLKYPFINDMLPSNGLGIFAFEVRSDQQQVKQGYPLADLELKLLNYKLEIFPQKLHADFFIPLFFGQQHSFCELWDVMYDAGYWPDMIESIFVSIIEKASHIVECFFVAQLMCLFTGFCGAPVYSAYLQVVNILHLELRRHVSLNSMLHCYKELITGDSSNICSTTANIIDPISGIFQVIASTITRSAVVRLPTFDAWATFRQPSTEYKFSVNDLMVFAYTSEHLKKAEDFIKPDVLERLVQFALRRGRKTTLQAIKIAANFGSTTPAVMRILLELFQNSLDAIVSSGRLEPERKDITIEVDQDSLSFEDYIGIPNSALLSFLIPFFSEKIKSKSNNGEMGTGGYAVFSQPLCKYVQVYTKAPDEVPKKIILTPVVENNMVVDINVQMFLAHEIGGEDCTKIKIFFNEGVDGVDVACQVHLECNSKFFMASNNVFLNGEKINGDVLDPIYAVPGVVTIRGFLNRDRMVPSIVTVNQVPFGSLFETWNTLLGVAGNNVGLSNHLDQPFANLQPDFKFNVAIDIDKKMLNIKQSRNRLEFRNNVFQTEITKGQLTWLLMRYSKGKLSTNFIQHAGDTGDISQLKFSDRPMDSTDRLTEEWFPDPTEFTELLHWIIDEVLWSGSPDQKGTANKIIDNLLVQDWIKDALKRWFANKQSALSTDPGAQGLVLTFDQQVAAIVSRKRFADLPVARLFLEAFVKVFNLALETIRFRLTTPHSAHPAQATHLPQVWCVNEGESFAVDGLYMAKKDMLLLSWRHVELCKGFVEDVRKNSKRLDEMWPILVKRHFFPDKTSTIVHEMIHCIFQEEHSAAVHSKITLVWKGREHESEFDGMPLILYHCLCQEGLNTEFLMLIQENPTILQ